jgi:hypothetical protein
MDELLVTPIELEKVLGEIGKTPCEPLQEKKGEELAQGNTRIDKHLQMLNEILMNYFGGGTYGKIILGLGRTNTI